MTTREAALRDVRARFRDAGLATPDLDARLLVMSAAGCDMAGLVGAPETVLAEAGLADLAAMAARRLEGEPVSRILGVREFWGLEFALGADTLDPRADSETLVAAALRLTDSWRQPFHVLDLGTGTGCLLLSILSERPQAVGVGIDCQAGAVDIARRNAQAVGLDRRAVFQTGDWGQGLQDRFELVVSNPPYIASGDIESLAPEVRSYDPPMALDGGEDGLDAYRALAGQLPDLLTADGFAVLEIGVGQGDAVGALLERGGLLVREMVDDLSGMPRAVVAGRPGL